MRKKIVSVQVEHKFIFIDHFVEHKCSLVGTQVIKKKINYEKLKYAGNKLLTIFTEIDHTDLNCISQ